MDDPEGAVSATTEVAAGMCVGWSVASSDGRVGVVERLLLDRGGCIEALDVRSGLFHARHELVDVGDVLRIVPERRQLVVRTARSAEHF
ncbi:MAG: hypothetical protein ABSB24_03765 [Gaiellaceae bacterium]|jgi:hypothetical protein